MCGGGASTETARGTLSGGQQQMLAIGRSMAALIADQNLENALDLCDRVYVLEKGQIKDEKIRDTLSLELLCSSLGVGKGRA